MLKRLFSNRKKEKKKQALKNNQELISASDLIAIDFETATQKRSSACAVAIIFVKDCEIISQFSQLIRPPGNEYSKINISIHGITPKDTRWSPTIAEAWNGGIDLIIMSGLEIVAHNARFDMSVLRSSLDEYGINIPYINASCTVDLAREMYPNLKNHKLPTVAKHIGAELNHHDPVSDAIASAKIMMEWRKDNLERQKEAEQKQEKKDSQFAQYDQMQKDLIHAKQYEEENSEKSAHLYFNIIKSIQAVHIKEKEAPDKMLLPRMPINRMTLVLDRAGEYTKCVQIIEWYNKYNDPIGLTATDQMSVNSRLTRVQKKIARQATTKIR